MSELTSKAPAVPPAASALFERRGVVPGTSLDTVTAVNLVPKKTGGKTLTYDPVQPQISTKIQFIVDATVAPALGEYSVTVNTATNSGISTTVSLVITP